MSDLLVYSRHFTKKRFWEGVVCQKKVIPTQETTNFNYIVSCAGHKWMSTLSSHSHRRNLISSQSSLASFLLSRVSLPFLPPPLPRPNPSCIDCINAAASRIQMRKPTKFLTPSCSSPHVLPCSTPLPLSLPHLHAKFPIHQDVAGEGCEQLIQCRRRLRWKDLARSVGVHGSDETVLWF